MVLDNLGGSLRNALKKIASANKIDKALVDEAVREIQRALLQADVNVKLVMQLSNTIKSRALGREARCWDEPERARDKHRLPGADKPGRSWRGHPSEKAEHHARRPAGLGKDDHCREAGHLLPEEGA